MQRVEHDLTDQQWALLKKLWAGCEYCGVTGEPLQRDCVLALSRGGRYTLANIVPACGPCNLGKGARTPEEAGMSFAVRVNTMSSFEQLSLV
jgi:5-methylcytosine-specific restriction endonuclease McrA